MNVIKITDLNIPELALYTGASENQLLSRAEPDKAVFMAESPYVISLALDEGFEPLSVLVQENKLDSHVLKRCGDVPIYAAEKDVLEKLTGYCLTMGMVCAMRRPAPRGVAEVCCGSRIAVLEHIMNPTNVGAIFRSAAALGMDGVLLSSDCADPLYRRAVRVSMGTVFQIPWAYFDKNEPKENIKLLSEFGFTTVAMALTDQSLSLRDKRLKEYEKLAVVLGSEGTGLSEQTVLACDHTVKIPMFYGVDSLNVAAAGALAFWELGNQQ